MADQWVFEKGVLPLGERFYAMVELGLNIPIYIVEVLYEVEEGEANWQRFLVSQFDDALRLVEPGVASHAISILLPRQASASYDLELGFIGRVEEGRTEGGRVSRLFTCSGGAAIAVGHVASLSDAPMMCELTPAP